MSEKDLRTRLQERIDALFEEYRKSPATPHLLGPQITLLRDALTALTQQQEEITKLQNRIEELELDLKYD